MAIPGLVEIGLSYGGSSILNQGMIIRTPNGDLYASAGTMGANNNLDPTEEKPIDIWYSNDDGATWVVSKEIYVDSATDEDWLFGGGFGGVCIASDSDGYVHIAFGIRRKGVVAKSNNVAIYMCGKHGDWGGIYNIYQVDLEGYPLDARPRVTSLAVDSNNLAHLLFSYSLTTASYVIEHLWDPGSGSFSHELVHGHSYSTCSNRLVIDGNDTIHVTYGILAEEKWYYKQKAISGGWGNTIWIGMDSPTTWYYGPTIAVDSDNTLHLAMWSTGKYRQRSEAGVWSSVEQFADAGYGIGPGISISEDDIVHLIIQEAGGDVCIRQRISGVWSEEERWTGTATSHGVCFLHSYYPKIGSQHINILETGWSLHIRFGHERSYYLGDFTKDAYVTTDPATLVAGTSATINGTLVYDGEEDCACSFEWGLTTDYGSTTTPETKNTGETFSSGLTGLSPGTTYHFRAKAVNSAGTFYGIDRTFTTIGDVFPSVATTRVSSLIHRWVPGSYTLEMVLGGLTSDFGLVVPSGKPTPVIPTLPVCKADEVLSWSYELGYFCIPKADIPPGKY